MRFCDFFIDYKISRSGIKSRISWRDLPRYRKIILSAILSAVILWCLIQLYVDVIGWLSIILVIVLLVVLIICERIDSIPKHQKIMVDNYYSEYSKRRMKSIRELLVKYKIDPADFGKIDLLIEKAKIDKQFFAPFADIEKGGKLFITVVVPVLAYIFKRILDNNKEVITDEIYVQIIASTIIIGVLIVAFVYALYPIIRRLLYRDEAKYDDLIDDLENIKIFGCNLG